MTSVEYTVPISTAERSVRDVTSVELPQLLMNGLNKTGLGIFITFVYISELPKVFKKKKN